MGSDGLGKHSPLKKIERARRCMDRMKKCAIGWVVAAILVFIIGILLLVFFGKDISAETWRRGVGISGVVLLIVGLVALAVAIFLIWAFCHLVRRQEESMANGGIKHKYHHNTFSPDLYPRQQGYDQAQGSPYHGAAGYPGGGYPAASAPEKTEPVNPDAIVIETDTKF